MKKLIAPKKDHGKTTSAFPVRERMCSVHGWVQEATWSYHKNCIKSKSSKKTSKKDVRRRRKVSVCPVHGKFYGRAFCGHRRHCRVSLGSSPGVAKRVVQFKEGNPLLELVGEPSVTKVSAASDKENVRRSKISKVIRKSGLDPKDAAADVENMMRNLRERTKNALTDLDMITESCFKNEQKIKEARKNLLRMIKDMKKLRKSRDLAIVRFEAISGEADAFDRKIRLILK